MDNAFWEEVIAAVEQSLWSEWVLSDTGNSAQRLTPESLQHKINYS